MKNESTPSAEEKTFNLVLNESEACLILSALAVFEDRQVQWARVALAKGRSKEAAARKETGKRILALSDRIEKEGPVYSSCSCVRGRSRRTLITCAMITKGRTRHRAE